MKRSVNVSVIAIIILCILGFTNPDLNNYADFLNQQITLETNKQSGFEQFFGLFFGKFAANIIAKSTIRNNYIIFSTYNTNLGENRLIFLGVLNNFITLKNPGDFKEKKQ